MIFPFFPSHIYLPTFPRINAKSVHLKMEVKCFQSPFIFGSEVTRNTFQALFIHWRSFVRGFVCVYVWVSVCVCVWYSISVDNQQSETVNTTTICDPWSPHDFQCLLKTRWYALVIQPGCCFQYDGENRNRRICWVFLYYFSFIFWPLPRSVGKRQTQNKAVLGYFCLPPHAVHICTKRTNERHLNCITCIFSWTVLQRMLLSVFMLVGAQTALMMFSMSTIISGCACARAGAASLHSF